mmetsp:Transcript_35918/g.89368  ORF Transcript_35918/g.89368 Transcript_35918/m.89368 type:complete len:392 (-) Transcript_35918:72-1247(-)
MDAFLGKVSSSVSSISDSIGEKSVRALGDMMASPTFTSPSQSETRSRYDDEEVGGDGGGLSGARKTRGSGDGFRSYDDAGGSGANSSWMPSAASAGGWLNRLGGAPNSEEAKDREPLVGRSPREANTEAAGGAGGVGASQSFSGMGLAGLSSSFSGGLAGLGLPSSIGNFETLSSLRSNLALGATSASDIAAAAASRARDGGSALGQAASASARQGSQVLAMAGVPLPESLYLPVELPPDPACALCNRYCPCPRLSYQVRLMGFAICFLLGFVLSLASLTSVTQLLLGNPKPFATKYTLGNAISICSSMFVMGPTTQCQNMFHPDRRGASMLYIGSMIGTFVSVSALHSGILTLLCVAMQMGALLWYVFSYIPYGRVCLRRCFNSAMRFVV